MSRRGHVVRVRTHAEADQLAIDPRAALLRMLVLLEHQHPGALAQHETVAVAVQGPAGRGRIVVARRQRRAAQNPPMPSGEMVASVPPATITSASPYSISRPASPMQCRPVVQARDDRQIRALAALHDRQLARDHVDDRARHEERRHPARCRGSAVSRVGVLDQRQAADARADAHADALGVRFGRPRCRSPEAPATDAATP